MKFDVTVQRAEYREHIFRVEAENWAKAWDAGLEAAKDYDFHDSPVDSADEDVKDVVAVEPKSKKAKKVKKTKRG